MRNRFWSCQALRALIDKLLPFRYSADAMEASEIKIYKGTLPIKAIKAIALATFGEMAKAVIDIEKRVIAVGGELHADAEQLLLQEGSKQSDVWGINLYPGKTLGNFIEYTSLINIRPSVNNRSQKIESPEIRAHIKQIIDSMLERGKKHDP